MEGKTGIEDTEILFEQADVEAKGNRIGEEINICNVDAVLANLVRIYDYESVLVYQLEH